MGRRRRRQSRSSATIAGADDPHLVLAEGHGHESGGPGDRGGGESATATARTGRRPRVVAETRRRRVERDQSRRCALHQEGDERAGGEAEEERRQPEGVGELYCSRSAPRPSVGSRTRSGSRRTGARPHAEPGAGAQPPCHERGCHRPARGARRTTTPRWRGSRCGAATSAGRPRVVDPGERHGPPPALGGLRGRAAGIDQRHHDQDDPDRPGRSGWLVGGRTGPRSGRRASTRGSSGPTAGRAGSPRSRTG